MQLTYTDYETGFEKTWEGEPIQSISFAFVDTEKPTGNPIVVLRVNDTEAGLVEVTDFRITP